MAESRIVEVTDTDTFGLIPPCADPRFDHRTCDYWEDADRGTKANRPAWLEVAAAPIARAPVIDDNPFAPAGRETLDNPFAPSGGGGGLFDDDNDLFAVPDDNPFAP